MKPKFFRCACCDQYHRLGWTGDCRDDANRFYDDVLDEMYGKYGWEECEEYCRRSDAPGAADSTI